MSSGPGQRVRRWTVSFLTIGVCAVWAMWPMEDQPLPVIAISTTTFAEESTPLALDQSAFAVPIWYAPPPEPEAELVIAQEPKQPAPFDLQLIAIIDMAGQRTAVFYDPRADHLIEVVPGDALTANRSVESIDGMTVVVRESTGLRSIELARGDP